jgi:hypothetical protein
MLNKIEKICMAHQYLIKMNTAKTALKWDENLKSSIFFYPPFYVKNSNNYIITLCMFLKGISLKNALKNSSSKQINNK